MIKVYTNKDLSKVEEKNDLMCMYRHSLGNECKIYSPIFFDDISQEYFIIIKDEHKKVYGLKTYQPLDKTEYFNKLNKEI